jgi:hypothetical protein
VVFGIFNLEAEATLCDWIVWLDGTAVSALQLGSKATLVSLEMGDQEFIISSSSVFSKAR